MKVIFDLDPKSLKKLEMLANLKQLSIGDLAGELVARLLNREPGASGSGLHQVGSSSASGLHAPVTGSVSASRTSISVPPLSQTPAPVPVDDETILMILDPFLARLRMTDTDGLHRKAIISELQMLLPDPTAAKVIELIRQSLA